MKKFRISSKFSHIVVESTDLKSAAYAHVIQPLKVFHRNVKFQFLGEGVLSVDLGDGQTLSVFVAKEK